MVGVGSEGFAAALCFKGSIPVRNNNILVGYLEVVHDTGCSVMLV